MRPESKDHREAIIKKIQASDGNFGLKETKFIIAGDEA